MLEAYQAYTDYFALWRRRRHRSSSGEDVTADDDEMGEHEIDWSHGTGGDDDAGGHRPLLAEKAGAKPERDDFAARGSVEALVAMTRSAGISLRYDSANRWQDHRKSF